MAQIPGLNAEALTAMFNAVGKPYIEGAFMTKRDGTYYLQYACPGTQYNTYADGVYTSKSPLGPFTLQASNPFSAKPGGFMTGTGHGSTIADKYGNYCAAWVCSLPGLMRTACCTATRILPTTRMRFRQANLTPPASSPSGCCSATARP